MSFSSSKLFDDDEEDLSGSSRYVFSAIQPGYESFIAFKSKRGFFLPLSELL